MFIAFISWLKYALGFQNFSKFNHFLSFQPAWLQRKIHLRPQHRGVHLVTEEILRQVSQQPYFEDLILSIFSNFH